MRLGQNPAKQKPVLPSYGKHRIILPVYLPSSEAYFERAGEVLQISLVSLFASVGTKAAITLIVNGEAERLRPFLDDCLKDGSVDQIVWNKLNRGKVDSVVAALRGCYEEFITVSDSDVYFKMGWIEATKAIFYAFPEAGMVSALPVPNIAWHCTSATVLGAAMRGELKRRSVVSESDLDRFANSVGTPGLFKESERRRQLVVVRNGGIACVGASHMQFTLRKCVVNRIPKEASNTALDGRVDRRWLDEPVDRCGLWRLSTTAAFVEHMGNVPERARREDPAPATGVSPQNGYRPPVWPLVSRLPWGMRKVAARALRRAMGS